MDYVSPLQNCALLQLLVVNYLTQVSDLDLALGTDVPQGTLQRCSEVVKIWLRGVQLTGKLEPLQKSDN